MMSGLKLPPRSTALVIVESTVSSMLVSLAVVGNTLILAALYRNPRLRNTTNVYIAALAVTDLLNACIPGTLFTSSVISGRLVYGMTACRLSGFLVHYLTYVSMATMTLTAVNRYYRVVKTQHYKTMFSFKRSLGILVILWLLVAIFVLYPLAFSLAEFSFNPVMSFCAYRFASSAAETVFTAAVVCIFVVFCLTLVSVSYYRVSKAIRHHNNDISFSLQDVTIREINLTNVLFTLVFAFALCWLPTFGVIIVIRLILHWVPHPLGLVIPFLMQTSSAVNPLIYGVMSPSFRQAFSQLLLCKRRDRTSFKSHQVITKSLKPETALPLETFARRLHDVVAIENTGSRNG